MLDQDLRQKSVFYCMLMFDLCGVISVISAGGSNLSGLNYPFPMNEIPRQHPVDIAVPIDSLGRAH